jgi:tetratricopeptide (TPR) repeat protein
MNAPAPRRLDPCPCGSGRRYKDCHGSLGAAPQFDGHGDAHALRSQGRLEEALALLDEKLPAQSDAATRATLFNLRGLVRNDLMDITGALADFEAALAIDPLFVDAHYNRGAALLLRGDYPRGWPEYAWRTRVPGYADYANFSFGMPRWNGEDLSGRSILVHAEQGQGDTIQFARFLGTLARSGAAVDVFCHPPLASLVARMPGVRSATSKLAERPTQDFHAPIMDLGIAQLPDAGAPHWFGAYVEPLASRVERFASIFAAACRPLVGIAWKGSPRHLRDRNRSLTREDATALTNGEATYVNLQLAEAPLAPSMIDAATRIADWDDTAAVVAQLDGVISVDTALAHLVGAMGRPVTVLLPFSPDWRWRERGETTPWYPSMTLMRQTRRDDWSDVFEAIRRRAAARG